ncbi:hypothetical protein JTE90_016785 [Oedothorax gibbosus]|uniref:VPS9 domain-containing protein n=1 Tax=Oedothorax gibbosus TaxID=931172 RepID=A0AAV6W050_9ARAC|nr:hypothetical protein JTE90_016785 [Oedothorax gibbosus]
MAISFDELENNPFYIALETKYIEKFKEAQKKIWHICVPFHKSLKTHIITKDFIDGHILKPSPFFKSHFVTTDVNNSSFEIEDGLIKTEKGVIKILMEETAYNDDYIPYKILIIERPLSCLSNIKDEIHNTFNSKNQTQTLNQCTTFLKSHSEWKDVLKLLDKKIQVFNSSYIVLPQYLKDASSKLKSILSWANSEFLGAQILAQVPPAQFAKLDLYAALENYIMFQVHDKVFPVVHKYCLEEDVKLKHKLIWLYEACVTPKELGVQETFCCRTPSAIEELSSINSKKCPVVKMNCLMSTIEFLNQDINNFFLEASYPVKNKDIPCVTSDDLIPLLVNVIVHSRLDNLISNLYYIENFCLETSPVDKLSFGLVTFQAAIEYLKNNEFEFLKTSSRKIQNQLPSRELRTATSDPNSSKKSPIRTKQAACQSPTDHLLENVSKMVETSSKDTLDKSIAKGSTSLNQKRAFPNKPQENVGSFLTSLRQNSLGLSYGKQT